MWFACLDGVEVSSEDCHYDKKLSYIPFSYIFNLQNSEPNKKKKKLEVKYRTINCYLKIVYHYLRVHTKLPSIYNLPPSFHKK